jgi:hypothetical protein
MGWYYDEIAGGAHSGARNSGMTNNDLRSFNGIDARTGGYLLELSQTELNAVAVGKPSDKNETGVREAINRHKAASESHYSIKEGIDPKKLEEAGWAVIFPASKPGTEMDVRVAALREALRPLLDLRRRQAGAVHERYYKEYSGSNGYRPGETKTDFLKRQSVGPGPADPEKVPDYLLLVGTPEEIPYRVQSQLSVQYAVGRLDFDSIEEFHHYARSVVAAENLALARRAGFFGVANPDDAATQASARNLIEPLADMFGKQDWMVDRITRDQASRAAFSTLLQDAPALLFAASHGMGFPKGDPNQLRHQGALLCQDWPGPKAWRGKPIPEEFYFAGEHLAADHKLLGSIVFLFACYGAGTPQLDEFAKQAFKERSEIAPHAFTAALPKALLGRPQGGALAVIGHVERAWGHSFMWAGTGEKGAVGRQSEVFESTLRRLAGGVPVGAAMEYFDERYGELSTLLVDEVERLDFGEAVDEYELAGMWTANNDARGYALLGDPAVTMRVASAGAAPVGTRALAPEVGVSEAAAESQLGPPVPLSPAPSPAESQASAPAVLAAEPGPTVGSYGIGDWFGKKEEEAGKTAEPGPLQRCVSRLGETLNRALDDATSLEVTTWVADDLGNAKFEDGKMVGAELRAVTRVALDGDAVVCLPQKDGEADKEVWEIHMQMVKQAQETRAELMKTLVQAATSLTSLVKRGGSRRHPGAGPGPRGSPRGGRPLGIAALFCSIGYKSGGVRPDGPAARSRRGGEADPLGGDPRRL